MSMCPGWAPDEAMRGDTRGNLSEILHDGLFLRRSGGAGVIRRTVIVITVMVVLRARQATAQTAVAAHQTTSRTTPAPISGHAPAPEIGPSGTMGVSRAKTNSSVVKASPSPIGRPGNSEAHQTIMVENAAMTNAAPILPTVPSGIFPPVRSAAMNQRTCATNPSKTCAGRMECVRASWMARHSPHTRVGSTGQTTGIREAAADAANAAAGTVRVIAGEVRVEKSRTSGEATRVMTAATNEVSMPPSLRPTRVPHHRVDRLWITGISQ